MVQAYCVKCRAKTDIKDPKEVKLKNGRPAVKVHVQSVQLTYSVLALCQKNNLQTSPNLFFFFKNNIGNTLHVFL